LKPAKKTVVMMNTMPATITTHAANRYSQYGLTTSDAVVPTAVGLVGVSGVSLMPESCVGNG
jgi:hypothetical protein